MKPCEEVEAPKYLHRLTANQPGMGSNTQQSILPRQAIAGYLVSRPLNGSAAARGLAFPAEPGNLLT